MLAALILTGCVTSQPYDQSIYHKYYNREPVKISANDNSVQETKKKVTYIKRDAYGNYYMIER